MGDETANRASGRENHLVHEVVLLLGDGVRLQRRGGDLDRIGKEFAGPAQSAGIGWRWIVVRLDRVMA